MLVAIIAYSLLACTCHAIQSLYPSYGSSGKASGSEGGSTLDGSNGCLHIFRENSAALSSHNAIYKVRRASAAQMHVVIFTLKERNMDVLKSVLHQVSDPRSKRYGDYMTKQEVNDLTTNPDSYSEIMEYLQASGAEALHDGSTREVITARAPVSTWERMLDTVFNIYSVEDKEQSVKNGDAKMQTFIRSEKYSVPSSLHEHIGSVLNTIQLPPWMAQAHLSIRKTKKNETWPSAIFSGGESNTLMTPKRLNEVYNIDDNTGHPKATQAIFGGTDSYFSAEDVTSFQGQFDLPLQSLNQSFGNHSISSAWCINNSIYPCVYSNLQIQYMMAMCTSPTIFYRSDYLTHSSWLREIYNSPNTPLVATIVDTYYEDQLSYNEVEDFENWAIKLGVIGVTVVVASGDDGASLSPEVDIILGTDISRSSQCSYASTFPASCPYVLTVGATQGLELMDGTEVVCQSNKGGKATSGGGFSTQYPRPDWQVKASNNYFAQMNGTTEMPYPGYGSGRGYPDISAAGAHFASFAGGDMISVSSTAASTSVVAGMLSLINSLRLKNGRRSVGWINPIIYGFSGTFMNDITVGKNNCNKWEECCEEGFSAAPGWDPVSGLGSIDFERFKKFMMNLDPYSEPSYPEPTSQPTRLQSLYTIPLTGPDRTEYPNSIAESQSPPISLPPPIATASAAPFAVPVLLPVHTIPTDNSISTSVPSALPTAARTLHAPLLIAYPESLSPSPTPALISPQSAYPTSREPNIGHLWRPTRGPYTPFPTLLLVPTNLPKEVTTSSPTSTPTQVPTATPSCAPSAVPSLAPSLKLDHMKPTDGPISTSTPSALPPATRPSHAPFDEYHYSRPTRGPDTAYPTRTSSVPSCVPTGAPTASPTSTPTKAPTTAPTSAPSCVPTGAPTASPTSTPTKAPTTAPTSAHSCVPKGPTASPTSASCPPRRNPVSRPTRKPTSIPVSRPTRKPTSIPTPKASKNRKSVRPSSSFPTPSCSKTK